MLSMWSANFGPLSKLLLTIPAKVPSVKAKVPKMINTLDRLVKDREFFIFTPLIVLLAQILCYVATNGLFLASFGAFCQT